MNTDFKKYAALIMAAGLTVSLAACSGGSDQSAQESGSVPESSVSESAAEESGVSGSSEISSQSGETDAFTGVLDGIRNFEAGTAGSSLKAVTAAGLMDWAEHNSFTGDSIREAVAGYISSMTDEEKDVMAGNAREIASAVSTLLTGDDAADLLEAAGNPQQAGTYTPEKSQAAMDGIIAALKELVPDSFDGSDADSPASEQG